MAVTWLVSYPKSGNTWLRALLSNYLSKSSKPVSINALLGSPIADDRNLFDEIIGIPSSDLNKDEIDFYRPRFHRALIESNPNAIIKTHHAFIFNQSGEAMFPREKSHYIYIVRNPLDIAGSYANHAAHPISEIIQLMGDDSHGFNHKPDRSYNKLHIPLLSWSNHVKSWVSRTEYSLLTIRYEDLLLNPTRTFKRVIAFMQLQIDSDRLAHAVQFSQFEALQAQEGILEFREKYMKTQRFFRKGQIDNHLTELSEGQKTAIIQRHRDTMRDFNYLD